MQKSYSDVRLHNRAGELVARRAALEHRRIRVSEVMARTGLPRNSVKQWLADDVSQYFGPVVAAWCAWLDCDLAELLYLA